jgi:hypothetical protein
MKTYFYSFLCLGFLFHISLTFIVNVSSFKYLKNNSKVKLNPVGLFYINNSISFKIPKGLKLYANYTGTDKGYTYYSPNLPRAKYEYEFYNENVKIENIVCTKEAKIKFNTMMINFTDNVNNTSIRENIVQSLFQNIQNKNQLLLNNCKMTICIKKVKTLHEFEYGQERDSIKKILAYKIKIN